MAIVNIQTLLDISIGVADRTVGLTSRYATIPHLGTAKQIEGWKWDERTWPSDGEFKAAAYAPSIWDPVLSGVDEDQYQSGYGDNKDLELLDIELVSANSKDVWSARLNHGFFFIRDQEWYLYSDAYRTEYFTVTGVENGRQVKTLSTQFKPTIPIQVRSYQYNRTLGRYETYQDFRKKVDFTDSPSGLEFTIEQNGDLPKLILNDSYGEVIGTIATGIATTLTLDQLGISDGTPGQEFILSYSPVDPSQSFRVWSWTNPGSPFEWSVIDSLAPFTASGFEVRIDKDLGILSLPLVSGVGPGHSFGAYYTRGIGVTYEPNKTGDDILAFNDEANINSIISSISKGFVQINTTSVNPASIVLSANLSFLTDAYLIQLGNGIGYLTAEVRSDNGDLLEGQEVVFELLEPAIGSFGTASEVTAFTDSNGEAHTYYNAPSTMLDLGQATVNVSYSGPHTIVTTSGITEPGSIEDLYIYMVHSEDEVLGIPAANLASYYAEYIGDETTSGISGSTDYEQMFRTINDLGVPVTYDTSDYTTGKKTILLSTPAGVMNPHLGFIVPGTFAPITPDAITNIGTAEVPNLQITYEDIHFTLPGVDDTKSYFVIGSGRTRVRAYTVNSRTGQRVYSNTIIIEIQIPDTLNGTYYSTALNDIPSGLLTRTQDVTLLSDPVILSMTGINNNQNDYLDGRLWDSINDIPEDFYTWFKRAKRGDTVGLQLAVGLHATISGLEIIQPSSSPATIPLGFRLKSTGITVASLLDMVTFLDPNQYPASGYFA